MSTNAEFVDWGSSSSVQSPGVPGSMGAAVAGEEGDRFFLALTTQRDPGDPGLTPGAVTVKDQDGSPIDVDVIDSTDDGDGTYWFMITGLQPAGLTDYSVEWDGTTITGGSNMTTELLVVIYAHCPSYVFAREDWTAWDINVDLPFTTNVVDTSVADSLLVFGVVTTEQNSLGRNPGILRSNPGFTVWAGNGLGSGPSGEYSTWDFVSSTTYFRWAMWLNPDPQDLFPDTQYCCHSDLHDLLDDGVARAEGITAFGNRLFWSHANGIRMIDDIETEVPDNPYDGATTVWATDPDWYAAGELANDGTYLYAAFYDAIGNEIVYQVDEDGTIVARSSPLPWTRGLAYYDGYLYRLLSEGHIGRIAVVDLEGATEAAFEHLFITPAPGFFGVGASWFVSLAVGITSIWVMPYTYRTVWRFEDGVLAETFTLEFGGTGYGTTIAARGARAIVATGGDLGSSG